MKKPYVKIIVQYCSIKYYIWEPKDNLSDCKHLDIVEECMMTPEEFSALPYSRLASMYLE